MIEWIMFIAFILALGLSLWKLKEFFPSEQLHDDDRTEEVENELMQMMLSSIEAYCIEGKVPTPRGPVSVEWTRSPRFRLRLTLPHGMLAQVDLPADDTSTVILVDGKPMPTQRQQDRLLLDAPISGTCTLEIQ